MNNPTFPWGLLTLILFILDLIWSGIYFSRKRLVKWLCRNALAHGKRANVESFLGLARTRRLIKSEEESQWRKEFGLEDQ